MFVRGVVMKVEHLSNGGNKNMYLLTCARYDFEKVSQQSLSSAGRFGRCHRPVPNVCLTNFHYNFFYTAGAMGNHPSNATASFSTQDDQRRCDRRRALQGLDEGVVEQFLNMTPPEKTEEIVQAPLEYALARGDKDAAS